VSAMTRIPRRAPRLTRRQLVQGAAGLGLSAAGGALLAGCSRLEVPPPATRRGSAVQSAGGSASEATIRLAKNAAICFAPQYVAEDLLRAEGFADVQYVDLPPADIVPAIATGKIDLAMATAGLPILQADADDSAVILAGVHVGCFELFASAAITSMRDLRGKQVAVTNRGSGRHIHLAAMAAYVGINPDQEITWVFDGPGDAIRQFTDGKFDAFMAFPPEPQMLRAQGIGHVIVNTNVDRPWSHYFCCMLVANRQFIQQGPEATKRATRSILKAADICASQPERAAQFLVDHGYISELGYAAQALKDVPYDRWRDYDPEDTVRFYSLRLQEIGMIKSSPEQIISRGTDWRFLNELKQELKV
jgi:NitT/TauT family transport system substrate-binding protein